MAYRTVGAYNSSKSSTAVVPRPSGTTNGDLIFVVIRRNAAIDPTGVPSGWTLIQKNLATYGYWLYYKVANNEGTSWTWTWAATAKTMGRAHAFYNISLNTASPIQSSTTPFSATATGTPIDIPTLTTSSANTLSFIFASAYSTSSKTLSCPYPYTEHNDSGSTTPDFWQGVASINYPASGTATGVIKYPVSATSTYRVGVQVLVNTTPPTISLGTPSNDSTVTDSTFPTFTFTGTDPDSHDLNYEIQVASSYPVFEDTTFYSSTYVGLGAAGNKYFAQSFQAPDNIAINTATFSLSDSTDAITGTLYARIYNHSGTFGSSSVPGTTLYATSNAVDAATAVGTTAAEVVFTFSGANIYTLTKGNYYTVVLDANSATSITNYYPGLHTSDVMKGNASYGNTLTALTAYASYDLYLKLYSANTLVYSATSQTNSGFSGSPDNTYPFTSGQQISYTSQTELVSGTQYFWRVRALDSADGNAVGSFGTDGTNYYRSFTLNVKRSKTQTAISRISNTRTKTQTATSKISVVKTKTQTAVSRIVDNITKTQSAVSRIALVVNKTQSSISRVSQTVTKTQSALATISGISSGISSKTQSATAKITDSNARFWIGGSGEWSDTNHWSDESGGTGGATVPTSNDDVFIDDNSGFTYIDPENPTYGDELVANGTFTGNASGWTLETNWSYNSNNIRYNDPTYSGEASQVLGTQLVPGKTYLVSINVVSNTADYVSIVINDQSVNNFNGSLKYITGTGTYVGSFVAEDNAFNNIRVFSSAGTAVVDDVSVKEVISAGIISLTGANYWTTNCHDITCTSGHTYIIDHVDSDLAIYGSAVFESGITFNSGTYVYFLSNTTETITSNGVIIQYLYFGDDEDNAYTGTWTLLDDLNCSALNIQTGTFDANDYNVLFYNDLDITSTSNNSPVIYMGNGTWSSHVAGYYSYYSMFSVSDNGGNCIIYPEESTILLTGEESVFYGGGKTYNNLVSGATDGWITIRDSNTFNNFELNGDSYAVEFETGSTQTANHFSINGESGNNLVIMPSLVFVDGNTDDVDKNYNLYAGSTTMVGQSFTGNGMYAEKIIYVIGITGAPTGSVNFKLYAHTGSFGSNGVPTGSPIETVTIDLAYLDTGEQTIEFGLTTLLVDGTKYFAVIEYTGGNASNCIYIGADSSGTHSGNLAYYSGSWTPVPAEDLIFSIYGTNQFNLSQLSGNIVADYIDIAFSNVGGGAVWYKGTGFVDSGNNTGWYTLPSGMSINVNGIMRDVVSVKINIGDTWKTVSAMKINIGDTWKSTQIV